jgi:cellobiose-specific phosphotransferase system component IIA
LNRDVNDLHLPNAKNCIQSALYQLKKGNPALAVEFLESAKRSLDKAHTPNPTDSRHKRKSDER